MILKFQLLCITVLITLIALPAAPLQAQQQHTGFAAAAFRTLWQRSDAPVAAGSVGRSWLWGVAPADRRYERYDEAEGGVRLVQYFDKARMEMNDPTGDPSSQWYVTNGLLPIEMMSGAVRTGDTTTRQRQPATLPVAGDMENPHPDTPTYAQVAAVATLDAGSNRAEPRLGERVAATLSAEGSGQQPDLAVPESELVQYEPATGHNIPRIFHDFLYARGAVLLDGQLVEQQLMDPLFVFGYPITEPYWIRVHLGWGNVQMVLFQAFERRILTYTPSNPVNWRVEMGNVGQHYMRWRYGRRLRYARPPLAEAGRAGVRTVETTIEIPTYAYEQALQPTTPDDPIYPYPRLERARLGGVEPRSYRAVVVENRFLTLTFLPDVGGRLYNVVDKASGHNLFYQNPVIKPSVFGQRGWWLGAGGLEWALPTEEHGYMEYLPWELAVEPLPGNGGLQVRLSATEQQTGMQATGLVGLQPDEGRFRVEMVVANETDTTHPLQMWTNAALAPGAANAIGEGLRFVLPAEQVVVHATQDSRLPAAGEMMAWPQYAGQDMSYPAHWQGYVGAFSPQPVPFIGVYDEQHDVGAAVIHGADVAGAKFFGFSDQFDTSLYTDDQSDYVELWSGAQPTFWDYPPLPAGAQRSITTHWLPLWGLGTLVSATDAGALGLQQHPDGWSSVTVASARIVPDMVVVVQVGGEELLRTPPLVLRPDQPLTIEVPVVASGGSISFGETQGIVDLQVQGE